MCGDGERLIDRSVGCVGGVSEAIGCAGGAYADMGDLECWPRSVRVSIAYVRCLEIRIDASRLGRTMRLSASWRLGCRHPSMSGSGSAHVGLVSVGAAGDALRSYQRVREILAEESGSIRHRTGRVGGKVLAHDPTWLRIREPSSRRRCRLCGGARRVDRSRIECRVERVVGEWRLVTITGVGGCGKTRLAIALGHQEAHRFDNGTFFVDLTSACADDEVVPAIVAGIGLAVGGEQRLIDQVVEFFAPRSCLLVVDNCEHVLDGVADALDELLTRCADLIVVATSREAISIEGERAWRIPSLAVVGSIRGARCSSEAHSTPTPFCRDGTPPPSANVERPMVFPLASSWPRQEPLDALEESRGVWTTSSVVVGWRRRRAARQQTLAGAVEWSHDLLDDDERTMLRRLAVFQGGFDLGDVGAVTGFDDHRAIELVDALVAKSLVDVNRDCHGAVRHRLLETIRLFALADEGRRRVMKGARPTTRVSS